MEIFCNSIHIESNQSSFKDKNIWLVSPWVKPVFIWIKFKRFWQVHSFSCFIYQNSFYSSAWKEFGNYDFITLTFWEINNQTKISIQNQLNLSKIWNDYCVIINFIIKNINLPLRLCKFEFIFITSFQNLLFIFLYLNTRNLLFFRTIFFTNFIAFSTSSYVFAFFFTFETVWGVKSTKWAIIWAFF